MAKKGNIITKPEDIVKQPTVLEFLGMEEKTKYSETDLETAIIDKLQKFLLEMGKGYLFESRQKRFTFREKEANMIDWLLQRITDGLGGKYSREFINFANYSKEAQEELENFEENCLISGMAVKKAFSKVSEVKCNTYLSEFPKLRQHFDRFRGKDTARYSREEIFVLMDGLEPQGDDMLQELYETGMLEAKKGKAFADNSFEIPKLYRIGLGLVLRGKP